MAHKSKLPDPGETGREMSANPPNHAFLGRALKIGEPGSGGATAPRSSSNLPNSTGSRLPSASGALPASVRPSAAAAAPQPTTARPAELGRAEAKDVYLVTLIGRDPQGHRIEGAVEVAVPRGSKIDDLFADLRP